jgi:GH43 family beta-xylosidase
MSGRYRNPVITGEAGQDHGDPFIIKFLDVYYLYHTGDTAGRRGVSVHRSKDLVHWEFSGYALQAANSGWAWSDLWAPEVVYEGGVFYMFISATRRRRRGDNARWQKGEGAEAGRRLGLARATNPLGPFEWDEFPLVDRWSIDGHPFRDDDGTMWLFYNVLTSDEAGWHGLPGTGTLCDRLVAADRLARRPTLVTFPSQHWEAAGGTGDWYWNEAPYVLKRRGTYFQMYSGGHFGSETYAVGCATARDVTGPWTKHDDNPILRGSGGIQGPGHHSFVYGPDVTTPYAVYHAHVEGDRGRKVLLDRLLWTGDLPRIEGPSSQEQPIPPTAHLDEDVPHRQSEAWVRGRWVEFDGDRFPLSRDDVWHQVESQEMNGRKVIRVGGVVRASFPAHQRPRTTAFGSDGDVACVTVTSSLEDTALHELPAGSWYVWSWGGGGSIDIELALDGSIDLVLGSDVMTYEGERGRYRFVQLSHAGPVGEISVHAGSEGALVTDLKVRARG